MQMPADIRKKLELQYLGADRQRALKAVQSVLDSSWNVGSIQYVRSIIVVSGGDIEKLVADYAGGSYQDPRDVIVAAERILGNPGDWGQKPFDES